MPQDASTDLQILGVAPEMLYNETTYDRRRGNTQNALYFSAARTAATATAALTNYNARGIVLVMNITAASGTGGLTLILEAYDAGTATYNTILQSTAQLATGTVILRLYPGLAPVANATANDVLPRGYRVRVAVGDASSYTYSIGQALIV